VPGDHRPHQQGPRVPRRAGAFAWDRWSPDAPPTAVFHDEQDRRVRDVGVAAVRTGPRMCGRTSRTRSTTSCA
jgi:hypothetical protein